MCYNVKYLKDKLLKYAKHHGIDSINLQDLPDQHFVNGFTHPLLPVIVDSDPQSFHLFEWGLIPHWIKNAADATKISKQTLNARSESVFEKPAFKHAAMNRRCLIVLDGFYEYHHFGKTTIPYFITQQNEEPLVLAGLWEKWDLKALDLIKYTASIVTTKANPRMAKIHNNPKSIARIGPRMPLILDPDGQKEWLKHTEEDDLEKERLSKTFEPFPEDKLTYYSVKPLQGNNGSGNTEKASEPYTYQLIGLP